jgi:hypothetical protein
MGEEPQMISYLQTKSTPAYNVVLFSFDGAQPPSAVVVEAN